MWKLRQPRVQKASGNLGQSVPALFREIIQNKLKRAA